MRVGFEAASHFYAGSSDTEQLLLDGESHRTAVTVQYRAATMEWGIEVPYLSHSGGFLDRFIDRWHDFFGLPDSGRENIARGQLRYVYHRDGIDRLRLTQRTQGVGDVRLLAAWPLTPPRTDAALRAALKLPTGNAQELHGSGAADLAVWVVAGCAIAHCADKWRWHAAVGTLVLGRGDVLPDQQRRLVAFGGLGGAWRARPPIVLKAELRAHTAFYKDTDLAPLGSTAMQLVLGGTWVLSGEIMVDVAVSEDIRVNTAPDVSFLISIGTRF